VEKYIVGKYHGACSPEEDYGKPLTYSILLLLSSLGQTSLSKPACSPSLLGIRSASKFSTSAASSQQPLAIDQHCYVTLDDWLQWAFCSQVCLSSLCPEEASAI